MRSRNKFRPDTEFKFIPGNAGLLISVVGRELASDSKRCNRLLPCNMDDDVEIYVAILTMFGLIAALYSEMNDIILILAQGFLFLRSRTSTCRRIGVLLITPVPIPEDSSDNRWRYFKGCIGALDGTYIPVKVPHSDIPRYRNCKGNVSVNVLAVCDKNMNYIYVLSGWEGSAVDSRILRDAVTRTDGLRVLMGSYYLYDGGYTNGNGFLAPYRGVRYHLKEWDDSRLPQNYQEFFNLKHERARNCIERSFGILKARWGILKSNSHYPIKTQNRFILVDPYEEDVPDSFTDVNDGNGGEDDFIDQVESSPAWTSWRDNLAMEMWADYVMKKAVQNIRRVWTYVEEMKLVNALKKLVVKGNKCDNGFKTGYLLLLENMLANKFPGTNLKGDPHINSKIHVWKKQYACLKTMLSNSGIGLNSTTYRIDALPEVWEAHLKVDPTARSLKNKTFPFYSDWCDIFGNDRATGNDS
ncbi:hypothetical protein ACS0TY_021036 [Phlomoides rotata]